VHQLLGLGAAFAFVGVRHAVTHVVRDEVQGDLVDCGLNGADLRQDV
jgi:hypothetical protein